MRLPCLRVAFVVGSLLLGSFARADWPEGSILVSRNSAGGSDQLAVYSRTGQLLHSKPIPHQAGSDSVDSLATPRDIALDSNGDVQIFYGTGLARWLTYDPSTNQLINDQLPQLTTISNNAYGKVATMGHYAYFASTFIHQMIRVDVDTRASQLLPFTSPGVNTGTEGVAGLVAGLDGLLYVTFQFTTGFFAFDPGTLNLIDQIDIPVAAVPNFAVDGSGNFYIAGTNRITKWDPAGNEITHVDFATGENLSGFRDINIHRDGTVVASNARGQVLVTNTELTDPFVFNVGAINESAYVAFVTAPVPEPGTFALAAIAAGVLFLSRRAMRARR